ncbi:MAG: hydantoinase B/oxoprolinase family protein [Candidatus Rokubacteria bacterium]|nr:hydantoinase B/oxoprolinase family protein [Candidatus Rokubacteria bacterium]
MTRGFDPFVLEILWNRLVSIVDEAAATLVRTSFSTVVRESYDFSCVLTDRRGNSLAQASASIPSFIGTLPRTVKHFLGHCPVAAMQPGDVFITNDPWLGTGHLPDVNVARPIFRGGAVVAFAASVAHSPDIGGRIRAPDAREVFEEGLRIPMMKLHDAGRPNDALLALVRANVRVPDQVIGDLEAQLAALAVAERRLLALMDEQGLDNVDDLAAAIHARSEQAMRQAIQALPDGEYRNELQTDGLAVPVTLKMRLTVTGDRIDIDFAGSSDQVDRAINVVPSYRDAYTGYPLKCALAPRIPNNEGIWRPITIAAPDGSILNPRYPAACGSRVLVGHYLTTLVLGALARAIPDRVIAATGSPVWCINVAGVGRRGTRMAAMFFLNGGLGAAAHRDGPAALSFPSNVSNTPVEIMETVAPVRVRHKRLVPDSGGAGRSRGGLGQTVAFENLSPRPLTVSFLAERTRFAATGLFGGRPGALGAVTIDGQRVDPKATHVVEPGRVIELTTPGGGGFGDARERDPARVKGDVAAGYVTPAVRGRAPRASAGRRRASGRRASASGPGRGRAS